MDFGKVLAWTKEQNELVVKTEGGVLGLSFVDEDILRLRFNPGEVFKSEETFVVVDLPPATDFDLEASPAALVMRTARLQVELGLAPLALAVFKDGAQQPLLATPIPGMAELHNDKSIVRFRLAADEHIYGLGQDPMARLDHRDQERRMWQEWGAWRRSGNAGIPFMLSSRGYAILLNSSWASRFAIGRAEVALPGPGVSQTWAPPPWPWGVRSGETHPEQFAILLEHDILDLFILCRPAVDELQAGYVKLTGHAPLPPKWALGFIQCKNRYRSFTELISVAREYRRRRIPLDALVIDWLWFKEFGDLEWALPEWADPEAAFKTLAEMGVHVLQAQHPFVEKNSLKYPTFKAKGFMNQTPEGTRPTYDHTNPAARLAWWAEIRRFYNQGLRGYWTDMGELEIHPPETLSYLGVRERVHNIYSLLWTKGLYEGQRSDFNERVFSLPRTAYAGIQRNGAGMWSGDISAAWEVLRDQVVVGQGVCLSGQQYWTTDIGGFYTDERFTPELFVRWLQWGAFCPLFRTHGTRPDNEAWSFGEQAEGFIADAIRLRYCLMPYIYSLAHQVTITGAPIMRAMLVDFPDDPVAAAQELQFMFGPALLVAPVVEAGARRRKVYLPQGLWYEFWSDQPVNGGQWLEVDAPLSRIPLFVRAGSIIPMGRGTLCASEQPLQEVEVHIYPGQVGVFDLYEDDGLTYDYEGGAYALTRLSMDAQGKLDVAPVQGAAGILPAGRHYRVVNPAAPQAEALALSVDYDLAGNGRCSVHALVSGSCAKDASLKATWTAFPQGWALKQGTMTVETAFKDWAHLTWELIPAAEALPLFHSGVLECEVKCTGQTTTFTRPLRWGSGYATRWLVAGNFANPDGQGLEIRLPVEEHPDLPAYAQDGRIIAWQRIPAVEFNPYGYVDLRNAPGSELPNGRGVAYARSRIWSETPTTTYMEISADSSIKLWLNGAVIYQNPGIVLKQVLKQPVTLKAGWNTVLVKAAIASDHPFGGRELGFNFRLVDEGGKVIDHLLYAA